MVREIVIEGFLAFENDFLWPYLTLFVSNEKGFRLSDGISIMEGDARGYGLTPITRGAKSSSTAFESFSIISPRWQDLGGAIIHRIRDPGVGAEMKGRKHSKSPPLFVFESLVR